MRTNRENSEIDPISGLIDSIQSSYGNSNTLKLAKELKLQWNVCFNSPGSMTYKIKTFNDICIATYEELLSESSILENQRKPVIDKNHSKRLYKERAARGSVEDPKVQTKSLVKAWQEVRDAKPLKKTQEHRVIDLKAEIAGKKKVLEQQIRFASALKTAINKKLQYIAGEPNVTVPQKTSFFVSFGIRLVAICNYLGAFFSLFGLPAGALINRCISKRSNSQIPSTAQKPQQPPVPSPILIQPQTSSIKRSPSDGALFCPVPRRSLYFLNQSKKLPSPEPEKENTALKRRCTL